MVLQEKQGECQRISQLGNVLVYVFSKGKGKGWLRKWFAFSAPLQSEKPSNLNLHNEVQSRVEWFTSQ